MLHQTLFVSEKMHTLEIDNTAEVHFQNANSTHSKSKSCALWMWLFSFLGYMLIFGFRLLQTLSDSSWKDCRLMCTNVWCHRTLIDKIRQNRTLTNRNRHFWLLVGKSKICFFECRSHGPSRGLPYKFHVPDYFHTLSLHWPMKSFVWILLSWQIPTWHQHLFRWSKSNLQNSTVQPINDSRVTSTSRVRIQFSYRLRLSGGRTGWSLFRDDTFVFATCFYVWMYQ
jgi:hypothetical protein